MDGEARPVVSYFHRRKVPAASTVLTAGTFSLYQMPLWRWKLVFLDAFRLGGLTSWGLPNSFGVFLRVVNAQTEPLCRRLGGAPFTALGFGTALCRRGGGGGGVRCGCPPRILRGAPPVAAEGTGGVFSMLRLGARCGACRTGRGGGGTAGTRCGCACCARLLRCVPAAVCRPVY